MAADTPLTSLSPIDEERFGIRTARSTRVTPEDLPEILAFCEEQRVALLVARCRVDRLDAVQAMERHGFELMDTLLYWAADLTRNAIPADTAAATWRSIQPGDERIVLSLAEGMFHDYDGHYHADPRLPRDKCDEAYVDWAVRSCLDRAVAKDVIIGEIDDTPAAFFTVRLNAPDEGEIVLGGTAPFAQGRGLYRSLMIAGLTWGKESGLPRVVISSQVTNIAVQKVWARLGLEPSHAYYTFHKWFD